MKRAEKIWVPNKIPTPNVIVFIFGMNGTADEENIKLIKVGVLLLKIAGVI